MLRINLLPASVAQRRLNNKLILGFAALLLLCIALPLLYNATVVSQLNQQTQDAAAAVQGKQTTDGLKAQATQTISQIGPIQARLDFAKAVYAYNIRQAELYVNLAKYTDPKIIYTDATYTGSTMTIKAYSPSIAEVGRYLQRIYRDPDFSNVTIDRIPGYPDGFYYKYYVGKTLVSVATPPTGANAPGAGPGGGFGPGGPGPGGFGQNGPFSAPSSTGGVGGTAQYGQTSQLLVTAENGLGEPVTPIDTIVQKSVTPFTLPRQIAEETSQLQRSVYAKRFVKGFTITVTATLVNPPVAPIVPGGPGGGAAGMGGPGGPPPGMGGPPPGMGGPPPGMGGPPSGMGAPPTGPPTGPPTRGA